MTLQKRRRASAIWLSLLAVACSSGGAGTPQVGAAGSAGSLVGAGAGAGAASGMRAAGAGVPGAAAAGGSASQAGSAGAAPVGGASVSSAGADSAESAGRGATGSLAGSDGGGSVIADGPLLAFPGAQGFGKNATGGRDGSVVHVTNLNDSGPGSFRDAVSSSNRIVVFDVGGYIRLKTAVSVKSNLTIAGQTAPGGGIGFRGGEISFANSSNVIFRYVRVRPGSETESTEDDALSLYRARNVMIDHSSFEFAPWNDIDAVSDDWQAHPVTDITIQDSLIANPTGQQFGAHTESVSSQMAWYRNVFANSHNRNPLAKMNTVFVNNLLYNYSAGYTTHTSTAFEHDILNNYFVFGPASTGTDNSWFQIDKNQSIFCAGNLKDTNLNGTLDGSQTTPYWYQGEGTLLSTAWSAEATAVAPLDAPSAARVAISLAGPLPRDPLDALIISQVSTFGKGAIGGGANSAGPNGDLYTSQTQTGLPNDGYGEIAAGTKPTDTDNDGMPDAWESENGSDVKVDDGLRKATSGYTLLERYLNFLGVPHATSAAAGVAIDLSTWSAGFAGVSPKFSVTSGQNGTVSIAADKHTVQFQPTTGFHGLAAFSYAVTGADGTAYSQRVLVLVTR